LVAQGLQFTDPFVYTKQRASPDDLEEIAHLYPLAEKILEWRSLSNDLAFLRRASTQDRVHPRWGRTRSGTSRIYARDPAVQNVSRDMPHLFVPAPGHVLVTADYSQAQLRIPACLSKDETLTKLCSDPDGDTHAATSEWPGLGETDRLPKRITALSFGAASVPSLNLLVFGISQGQSLPGPFG